MGTDFTNDTTLDDEYEMQRIDSLTPEQQDLLYRHHLDQFEAVPSYVSRDLSKED